MCAPERLNAFTAAMLQLYVRVRQETGYQASYFHNMVGEQGGREAVLQLIRSPKPSEGFFRLYDLGRLDFSAEAVVLDRQWDDLFGDDDRRAAYTRLAQFEYAVPEDFWHPAN